MNSEWVLVPREATWHMQYAMMKACAGQTFGDAEGDHGSHDFLMAEKIYAAMLAAAPRPAAVEDGGGEVVLPGGWRVTEDKDGGITLTDSFGARTTFAHDFWLMPRMHLACVGGLLRALAAPPVPASGEDERTNAAKLVLLALAEQFEEMAAAAKSEGNMDRFDVWRSAASQARARRHHDDWITAALNGGAK